MICPNAAKRIQGLKEFYRQAKAIAVAYLTLWFSVKINILFRNRHTDDLAYSKYAYSIDRGIEPDSTYILSSRIGILYPTFFSYRLFGVNDFSSVIFVLLASLGSIILAYLFGKLIVNEKTGLMAAFLLAIFPLEIINSTKLLTDIPSAFFMALGVYIFLYSEKGKKGQFFYFLSGAFIGIGYMIRESAILIALFFTIYILFKRQIKKAYFFSTLTSIFIQLIKRRYI